VQNEFVVESENLTSNIKLLIRLKKIFKLCLSYANGTSYYMYYYSFSKIGIKILLEDSYRD